MTENEGTRGDQSASEETAFLSRRDLDDGARASAGPVDGADRSISGGVPSDHRAAVWDGDGERDGDEATVVARAVGAHQAWPTTDGPTTGTARSANRSGADGAAGAEPTIALAPGARGPVTAGPVTAGPVTAGPVTAGPVTGAAVAGAAGTAEPAAGVEPGPRSDTRDRRGAGRRSARRLDPGEEVAVFPAHRPWTMVIAGILALLWGIEAAFELAFNWSRVRGLPDPSGRYGRALGTLAHSSTSVTDFFARVALNAHFAATDRFDARLALGLFAVIWLIIGMLLLVARGSGIRLGLFWCGLVALPAFGLARGGVDADGWGLRHLVTAATTGGFAAPLILAVLIALLTGTRRARLFSGRPADPEYMEVNDPGEVWRGDR